MRSADIGIGVLYVLMGAACPGEAPAPPLTDGGGGEQGPAIVTMDVDFDQGEGGFIAGFSDYPVGEEVAYELEAGLSPLPAPLDGARRGYLLSGNNHSDDLFMYLRGRAAGLRPRVRYAVGFSVELATDAPTGCAGIGGPPGEAVWLKAGVAQVEPLPGRLGQQVDKGNQAQGGRDAVVLGTIGNTNRDCTRPRYELKTLTSAGAGMVVEAAQDGSLWAFVGTDSGHEGKTRLYYTRLRLTFTPQ